MILDAAVNSIVDIYRVRICINGLGEREPKM